MKLSKILKSITAAVLSTSIIISSCVTAYAAETKYSFSDLNLVVSIPDELITFTRNITSANRNLSLLDTDADTLRIKFEQQGIYLESFPKDISYEIIITGHDLSNGIKNFNEMNDSELNDNLVKYTQQCKSVATDTINSVSLYNNGNTNFYVIDFSSNSEGIIVHALKYYTVMNGKEISFSLQAKEHELNETQNNQLKNIVDTSQFQEVNASISESPIFTELTGYIGGIIITVGVLGLIVFFMSKATKKPQKK